MKILLLLSISLCLFANVDRKLPYPDLDTIDANEIAKQIYFVNHQLYLNNQILKSSKTNSLLIVRKGKGKKARVIRAERYLNNDYNDGITKSKDLVVFLSSSLKGTGVLAREFIDESKSLEIRMWLPALRKVRRMAEPAKNMGYSAADVAFLEEAKLRRLSDDAYELINKSKMNFTFRQMKIDSNEKNRYTKKLPQKIQTLDAEVYILKATPQEAAWYDYRVDYVDAEHFTTYRTKFFREGKIVKIIDRQWEKIEGLKDKRAFMWRYWYSVNPETGFETVNYIPKKIIQNNSATYKSSFWSERTLRKLKY